MVWNQALAHSTVPKISVIIRKSVGAAYGNMCGPTMGADFVVAWPTAEINFTGPEVGINVVYGRQLQGMENAKEVRQELLEKWTFDSSRIKRQQSTLSTMLLIQGILESFFVKR